MKKTILFGLILLSTVLSGCIEIIDDLSFNADGSGTLKYSINLSSSKIKINSILALDSLDGKPVPSRDEIAEKISLFQSRLMQQEGISNVEVESDFVNYLFKLHCDFENAQALQTALKTVGKSFSNGASSEEFDHDWLRWEGNELVRSIPDVTVEQTKRIKSEDIELLKQGTYTSITRFAGTVVKFDNENALLSKNRMAVMVKADPYSLMQNTGILENRIYLSE